MVPSTLAQLARETLAFEHIASQYAQGLNSQGWDLGPT
jgi:hypothetical protein